MPPKKAVRHRQQARLRALLVTLYVSSLTFGSTTSAMASSSPISGLLSVKALAVLLGIYCSRMGRERLLVRINVLFALLIAWNLVAFVLGSLGVKA